VEKKKKLAKNIYGSFWQTTTSIKDHHAEKKAKTTRLVYQETRASDQNKGHGESGGHLEYH